jgi:RNA polymerase sigma-70 factor (ECF subfamily)
MGYTPEAEDTVSDTFVIAMTKLHTLKNPQNFKPWLYTILKNVCRTYWRSTNKEHPLSPEFLQRLNAKEPDEPEQFMEKLVLKNEIWSGIGSLSDSLRVSVMLRYFSNFYTYREISQILQIPQGTVKSRLSEAKNKLKDMLTGNTNGSSSDVYQEYLEQADYHKLMWQKFYRNLEGFKEYFASNLYTFFPQQDSAKVGLGELRGEILADLRAESIFYPQSVVASNTVSIVEGKFANSPKTPFRCPPNALAVLFHPKRRVERLHLYLSGKEK